MSNLASERLHNRRDEWALADARYRLARHVGRPGDERARDTARMSYQIAKEQHPVDAISEHYMMCGANAKAWRLLEEIAVNCGADYMLERWIRQQREAAENTGD